MKEVEILVKVNDEKKQVLERLNQFESGGVSKTLDLYFFDPKRKDLKPHNKRLKACFRLRKKGENNYATYKTDKFDEKGKWIYSEEHETKIDDFEEMLKIIRHLGFEPLIEIDNSKHVFYTEEYEIVLEEVKGLGLFLEVERLNVKDSEDILQVKSEIMKFIKDLKINVSEELNMGKPELMLRRLNPA